MNGVNLIPAYRIQDGRRKRHMRLWSASCAVYALLCMGAYALCAWACGSGGSMQAGSLEAATSDYAEAARTSVRLREELTEAQSRLQAERSIAQQPDWSVLLSLLSQLVGNDTILSDCQLAPTTDKTDHPVLTIHGFAHTQASVSAFTLRLEGVNLFDQVKLIKSNHETYLGGDAVGFELECTFGSNQGGS